MATTKSSKKAVKRSPEKTSRTASKTTDRTNRGQHERNPYGHDWGAKKPYGQNWTAEADEYQRNGNNKSMKHAQGNSRNE